MSWILAEEHKYKFQKQQVVQITGGSVSLDLMAENNKLHKHRPAQTQIRLGSFPSRAMWIKRYNHLLYVAYKLLYWHENKEW